MTPPLATISTHSPTRPFRPFGAAEVAALLAFVGLLCYLRSPLVFTDPRLWAEEADLYLAHAMSTGLLEGLFSSPASRSSSLGILAVLPFVLGVRIVPLEWIPALTTGMAALVYALPIVHLLVAPSHLVDDGRSRLLAVAVLLFAPYGAASGETWMNTMNTGPHLGVLGLVLCTERLATPGAARRWYARVLLALGSLSGVYLAVLAPVFGLKAFWERTRESRIQFGIVAAGLVVQAAVFLHLKITEQILDQRLVSFLWAKSAIGVLEYQLFLPVLGIRLGIAVLAALGIPVATDPALDWTGPEALAWGALAAAVVATVVVLLCRPLRPGVRAILGGAFLTWAALTAFFSVNAIPWGRYSICPSVALGLLLLAAARFDPARPVRLIAAALLVPMLAIGAYEFQFETPDTFTGRNGYAVSWRRQVEAWRRDPDRRLEVWPAGQWHAYLPEPRMQAGMRSAVQRLAAARPAALSVLELDVAGLPAVFGIELQLAAESGETQRYGIELQDASRGALYRAEVAAGAPIAVDSIRIREAGFAAFSRVRRIVVAPLPAPPRLPRFRVHRARLYSPLMTWNHPRSGK